MGRTTGTVTAVQHPRETGAAESKGRVIMVAMPHPALVGRMALAVMIVIGSGVLIVERGHAYDEEGHVFF